MISSPTPDTQITRGQYSLKLLPCQKAEHGLASSLARDGQDPLASINELWRCVTKDKTNERANGRQSGVARSAQVPAVLFQVIQKAEHVVSIQIVKRDSVDRLSSRSSQEQQQEAKGVAIGGDGMRTGLLGGAQVNKESLQQNWKRRTHQSPKFGRCNAGIDGRPPSERNLFAVHTNMCFGNTRDQGSGIAVPNGALAGRPSEPSGQSAALRTYAEDHRAADTYALRYWECRGPTDGTCSKWHGSATDVRTGRQRTDGRMETVPFVCVDMI